MDFWEGAFLGPIWSHTDYQDRNHPSFHFGVGLLAVIYALIHVFLLKVDIFTVLPTPLYLVIFLVLLFALPFAAARYYSFSIPSRLLILMGYGLQYLSAWLFIVQFLTKDQSANPMEAFLSIGELANNIMTGMSEFFSFLGGIASTLVGVISGAVLMGLVSILLFIVVVYIPLFYFFVIKRIQRLIDRFVLHQFYRNRIQRY